MELAPAWMAFERPAEGPTMTHYFPSGHHRSACGTLSRTCWPVSPVEHEPCGACIRLGRGKA